MSSSLVIDVLTSDLMLRTTRSSSSLVSALSLMPRYNQTARPFNWKYTAADLAATLDRISAHQQPAEPPASLPKAA